MKYSLVVVLIFLAYLAVLTQVQGNGTPKGKAKGRGGLKFKPKGKKGFGFKLPKGVEDIGMDLSAGVERLKVVSKRGGQKKGVKMILWRELAKENCKNPAGPVDTNATSDGTQTASGEASEQQGCAGRPLHLAVASLYEVDDNKEKVADGRSVELKNVDFNCNDPDQDLTEVGLTSEDGAPNAVKIGCSVTLAAPNPATIEVAVYIATENGTITIDDEDADVEAGELKFTLTVSGWQFTDSAAGLNFEVEIGSKGKPKNDHGRRTAAANRRTPKDLKMEDGATLSFSQKVKVDGTYKTLNDSDINTVEKGGMNVVQVFLPKGDPIFYDPTAQAGTEDAEGDDDDNSAGGLLVPISTLTTMLLVALLSMM